MDRLAIRYGYKGQKRTDVKQNTYSVSLGKKNNPLSMFPRGGKAAHRQWVMDRYYHSWMDRQNGEKGLNDPLYLTHYKISFTTDKCTMGPYTY